LRVKRLLTQMSQSSPSHAGRNVSDGRHKEGSVGSRCSSAAIICVPEPIPETGPGLSRECPITRIPYAKWDSSLLKNPALFMAIN